MRASVIIRSRDEADRLRLTLASLVPQTQAAEIIVVDDGSRDHTASVVAEADDEMPILYVRHTTPRGRAGAANAGASYANGDILIFLDGDTLAAPDLVARHLELHGTTPNLIGRGETWHLRGTRWFANPETGAPLPEAEDHVRDLPPEELARLKISRRDILENFSAIHARAQQGIYPGAAPRRLYQLEMEALHAHPGCGALWAAAAGANQSVPAAAFAKVGGFDDALTLNEHRELALRLCHAGLRMAPAAGARSYHMTHRSFWRDPLADTGWEDHLYRAHPIPEVALLRIFWSSIGGLALPEAARITTLPQLAAAAARLVGISGLAAIREAHLANAEPA